MRKPYYVPMAIHKWEEFFTSLLPLPVRGPGVGALLVYETREEAEAEFPDHGILVIEQETPDEETKNG